MFQNMIHTGDNQLIQMVTGINVNVVPKKSSRPRPVKRNPWGNSSYADLITQAIETSPQKKLTLSEIYEWMIQNIPYFSNQQSSNSSAGWKNSIRHNLSLHEKFLRIKNEEGTNFKSSWWTINKLGGTGKTTRRKNHSRKKKNKSASPSQKANSFCRKFAGVNSTTKPLPAGSHESPHSNVSVRKSWQSCLSTSSEENESVYSVSSCNSSSSIESEIRDSFYNLHPFNRSFRGYQTINELHDEIAISIDNASLNIYNYEFQNAVKGELAYYPLEYYPSYNYLQYSTPKKYLDATSMQDHSHSRVSREYFKSPHHLSGSYMTSELSEDGSKRISSNDCPNPNFPSAENIDDQSPNIQDSPVLTTCLSQQDLHAVHEAQKLSKNLYNTCDSTGDDNEANLGILCQKQCIQSNLGGSLSDSNSRLEKPDETKHVEKNDFFQNYNDNSDSSIDKQKLDKEGENISCDNDISNTQKLDNATDQNCLKNISHKEINVDHDATKLIPEKNCLDSQPPNIEANNLNSIKIKTHIHSQFQSIKEENNVESLQQLYKLKNQIGDLVYYDSLQTIVENENFEEEVSYVTNTYQTESSKFYSTFKIEAETSYDSPKSNRSYQDILEDEKSSIKCKMILSKKDGKTRKRANIDEKDEENIERHKLRVSEETWKNEKEIFFHIQNQKCQANNSFDAKREVYDKLWSLMTKMVSLVLQKAGNLSSEKLAIDHILNKLSLLSHNVSLKQFFSILIEFACALELTYVEQFVNIQEFHSLNQSLELLLRDNKKYLSFIDVINLYLNLMSHTVKVNFCEHVLNDADIKAMDIPLDLSKLLTMYKVNAASAMTQREFAIPMTHLLKVNSNESCKFFVFPSISLGQDSTAIKADHMLNNIKELHCPHYFQDSCTKPATMTQVSSMIQFNESYSQPFLDPNSSDLVNHLQYGIQDDITSYSSNFQLCIPLSAGRPSLEDHVQQNVCLPGHQPGKREDTHADNPEPQKDEDSNLHDTSCGTTNDNVMDDILPDDLQDIEMLYDYSLTEYPEFEFDKNNFDFDMYLKENGENMKNRQ